MSDVTRILEEMKDGDHASQEALLSATYQELRRIARGMMARERSDHTLQATALAHEAFIKITKPDGSPADWDSRGHYFSVVAEAMRRILIDHARSKQAVKRGGDQERTTWDEAKFEIRLPRGEMLAVHEALDELEKEHELAATVVKLKYFVGMTVPEIAAALEVSKRTVDRLWQTARGFLHQALSSS